MKFCINCGKKFDDEDYVEKFSQDQQPYCCNDCCEATEPPTDKCKQCSAKQF